MSGSAALYRNSFFIYLHWLTSKSCSRSALLCHFLGGGCVCSSIILGWLLICLHLESFPMNFHVTWDTAFVLPTGVKFQDPLSFPSLVYLQDVWWEPSLKLQKERNVKPLGGGGGGGCDQNISLTWGAWIVLPRSVWPPAHCRGMEGGLASLH